MKSDCHHAEFFLSLFFFLCLFPLFAARPAAAGELRGDLAVSFDPAAHSLSGTARFNLAAGESLALHTEGLEIGRVVVDGKKQEVSIGEDGLLSLTGAGGNQPVEIVFSKIIEPGASASSMIDSQGIVLLDLWYPLPLQPAVISLTAEIPADFSAVSEADEIVYQQSGETKKVSFSFAHPLSYVHFIAGPYQVKEEEMAGGTVVATYFFPEDQDIAEHYGAKTRDYLARYEKLIGPYPYKRYSVVENRLPTGFAMPTFTLLGQSVVRLPFITETSLGHEVLHTWFGNAVGVDYELGNWCEGLTTYLADQAFAADKGEDVDFRKGQLIKYQSLVRPDNTMTVADFKDAGDHGVVSQATRAVGYNKVSMIFHMLRKKVGDEVFYAALRDFYQGNKFRNASWDDIKQSFNKAADLDLTSFFDQWLLRPDVPVLTVQKVKLDIKDGEPKLTFDLVQHNNPPYHFTVPVQVENGKEKVIQDIEVIKAKTQVSFSLTSMPPTMEIDPDYDLMRRLVPDELPPVWSRFQGGVEKIAVLADGSQEKFAPLLPMLKEMDCAVVTESELDEHDLGVNNLLFLGTESKGSLGLFAKPNLPATGFTLEVRENPLTPGLVAVLVQAQSMEQVAAVARKLSHYGKYGYLHFEDGKNTEKRVPESDYGIGYFLDQPPRGTAVAKSLDFAAIMDNVADSSRVVYVGETHVNQADHLLQFRVLQAIHQRYPEVAVGMEMFNRSSQPALDAYIKGDIDERQFLKDAQYFKNWGYDYRFYRDILQYARQYKLPVIGLNLDKDIVSDTFKEGGIAALPPEIQEALPKERDLSMPGYRQRLTQVFQSHSGPHFDPNSQKMASFVESQVLWDETMSQTIADYLTAHPPAKMVIIAGSGHVVKENAIPPRVTRRIPVKQTVLVNVQQGDLSTDEADYVFFSEVVNLPPSPMLGVMLAEKEEGPTIEGYSPNSGAKEAGMKQGDVIQTMDGHEVHTVDDIKINLLYKEHGSKIKVKARRPVFLLPDALLDFDVQL
ncbi:MAG: ChaN family lipoprotein [Proteobacteria bacterium]|nr:ChaN family lipoprotein [Pseudomonadota bacterium]MBU4297710.1 ChaN family lipoprotein [Pseudomonadota bacterium]MCG2746480.1 ChaN family lipoprotein [Desulfobulbaceae bacterium]